MNSKNKLNLFEEFQNDFTNQWHDFREFEYLFYGSKARIELLNKVAKHFFGEMFYAHLDRIVLAVSRLTDPPGSGERQNLSLKAVHEKYEKVGSYPAQVFKEVTIAADKASSHVSQWRNKRIAHTDLEVALNSKKLDKVNPSVIGDFYQSCGEYVSGLSEALGQGVFPTDIVSLYGARDLVLWLQRAVATREAPDFDIMKEQRDLMASKYSDAQ